MAIARLLPDGDTLFAKVERCVDAPNSIIPTTWRGIVKGKWMKMECSLNNRLKLTDLCHLTHYKLVCLVLLSTRQLNNWSTHQQLSSLTAQLVN